MAEEKSEENMTYDDETANEQNEEGKQLADDPESGVASDNDEIDKDGKLDEQECQNNNTRLIPKEEESRISISFFRQLFPAQKVDEVTPTKKKPLFKATLENFDPEENLTRFTTIDESDQYALLSENYKRCCAEQHRGYTHFLEPVEWPKKLLQAEPPAKPTTTPENSTEASESTASSPSNSILSTTAKFVELNDIVALRDNLKSQLKQQEPDIDYATWCRYVESENPARRELAANALLRIVTALVEFKKNCAHADEELLAANSFAECTAPDLITHIESLMSEREHILRPVCQQLPECAKHMFTLQAPYDEQFNYRIVPLLLQMLFNEEIKQSNKQLAFTAIEQLLGSALVLNDVVQHIVVPALFYFLRHTNELSHERRGSFDLIGEGDNMMYGQDETSLSPMIQLNPSVLRILRNFMANGFQRYNIVQCGMTGRIGPWLSREWMQTEFVPQFVDLFIESEKLLVQLFRPFREGLAESLAPIAKWLGTAESDVLLLPVFQRFMRDATEVQCAALKQLANFCKILSAESRELLVSDLTLMVTVDADTRSWRQRAEFAEQLIQLVPLFPIDQVNKYLSAFALTFATDRICQVRQNGISLLAAVLGAFIRDEWTQFYAVDESGGEDNKAEVTNVGEEVRSPNSSQGNNTLRTCISISSLATSGCSFTEREEQPILPLTDKLLGEIRCGFWRTRNWRRRQSFGALLYVLIRQQLVNDAHFCVLFFHDLLNLSDDDVPNVRQYFCLLAQLNQFEEHVGRSVHNRLEQMAMHDADLEIRNLAKIALGKLNPDEDDLDLSGGRANGLLTVEATDLAERGGS